MSEPPKPQSTPPELVRAWDPFVRIGHWTILTAFIVAYSDHHSFPQHSIMGYTIFTVVVARVIWGFIGTKYARFTDFIYSPREIWDYTLAAFRMGEAKEYISHNPMAAMMVFTLLFMLFAVCITGMMVYSSQQMSGPLGDLVPFEWMDRLELIHRTLARTVAWLGVVHFFGIMWASWWHRQNYIWPMITGMKVAHKRRAKRTSAADRKSPRSAPEPTPTPPATNT